ncbi:MAG: MFS transporter [Gammaproteobacteria bacterium]
MRTSAGTQVTLLLVGSMMTMTGALAPALPAIHHEFAAHAHADVLVRMLLTLPAFAIALVAPGAGYVLDRYSKRRVLLVGVAGFVVFGSAGLLVDDLEGLLLSRIALGVAIAFMMSGAMALAGDLFEPSVRASFLGRQVSTNSLTGLTFLLCGGALADFTWRAAFAVYLSAALLLVMLWRYVPAHPRGIATQVEVTAARESPPWRLICALYALGAFGMAFFFLIPTQSPFLIAEVFGGSALMTSIAIGAATVGAIPTSLAYGYIRRRLSSWAIFAIGFAVNGLGFVLQGLADSLSGVVAAMGVSGLGFGLVMPNLTTTLLGVAPAHLRGRLSGGLTASVFLGQFLSPLLNQPLITRYGFASTFLIAGSMLGLMAVMMGLGALRTRTFAPLPAHRQSP